MAHLDQSAMPPEQVKNLRESAARRPGVGRAGQKSAAGAGGADGPLPGPLRGRDLGQSASSTTATRILLAAWASSSFCSWESTWASRCCCSARRGVWKRLRAAPLSRAVLLGSRATSAALTSMFVLLVLFGFARVVFGVRIQGSMAGFLGVCAAFSLMTASFGLLVAALGKTPEATRGLAIITTLFMVMLGGAWVPTFIFPAWLQKLTVVIPTRWAMDGLDAMTWRGLGFSAAALPIALLTGTALLFGALAVMRFRWEADG